MLVYLREAHPADGWKIGNWSTITDPTTFAERCEAASQCCAELKFEFTTLVDTMQDTTAVRWAAWPERIFVIDPDGKVAYAGHQGPWGFWPTDRYRARGRRQGLSGPSLEGFLADYFDEPVRAPDVKARAPAAAGR